MIKSFQPLLSNQELLLMLLQAVISSMLLQVHSALLSRATDGAPMRMAFVNTQVGCGEGGWIEVWLLFLSSVIGQKFLTCYLMYI